MMFKGYSLDIVESYFVVQKQDPESGTWFDIVPGRMISQTDALLKMHEYILNDIDFGGESKFRVENRVVADLRKVVS